MNITKDDIATANIVKLETKFKQPVPGDKVLLVEYSQCRHGPFLVDDQLAEVKCGKCGEKLNPMFALKRLCNQESEFHQAMERYQEEMKRLSERSRTKCQHCHKLTNISHN